MRKITHLILVLAAFVFSVALFTGQVAQATVGGPTYVYSFKYNPQDESVYFIETSMSGRGCPPELKKISLNTGEVSTVYSCDEGEELLSKSDSYDSEIVLSEIRDITANFKDLSQINLRKNNISVDVDFVRDNYLEGSPDWLLNKEFTATIFQNNKELSRQMITGCDIDQPFTYAGYSIPGFEKKIIMLVSAVEDCFEGGYTGEKLLVVGGLNELDKNYATNYRKGDSPLMASAATLVVSEADKVTGEKEPEKVAGNDQEVNDKEIDRPSNTTLLVVSAVFVLGLFVGVVLPRKSRS